MKLEVIESELKPVRGQMEEVVELEKPVVSGCAGKNFRDVRL